MAKQTQNDDAEATESSEPVAKNACGFIFSNIICMIAVAIILTAIIEFSRY